MYVEVVYSPTTQTLIRKKIPYMAGLTIAEVIAQSGLANDCPEIENLIVGIFSNPMPRTTCVNPGDRVEIYRPLMVDPKEKRRQRVKA